MKKIMEKGLFEGKLCKLCIVVITLCITGLMVGSFVPHLFSGWISLAVGQETSVAFGDIRINEIMFDPLGDDTGNEWIELYNNDTVCVNISGWTISNRTGDIATTFPDWFFPNSTYLVIYFGVGINDSNFTDGNGSFYTGINATVFNNTEDECALYNSTPSDTTIVDFVSWCFDGDYNPGQAHDYAVNVGIWNYGDYFELIKMTQGEIRCPDDTGIFQENDTIGRDSHSSDSDSSYDWMNRGGLDARGSTPGLQNVYPFILNVTISTTKPNHMYDITSIPDGFRGSILDELGICWFQSVDGEGAGQQITIVVTWGSAKMKDWKYSSCFGDPGSGWIPDTDGNVSNTWTIDPGDSDSILNITVRDENGKTDPLSIYFKADNDPPGTPANVECKPDGYNTTGDTDDDLQIFLMWNNTDDTGSGVRTYLAEIEDPTPDLDAGLDERDMNISNTTGLVTYYVRAVDNVGNYGNASSDTITIGTKPIIHDLKITTTKPDYIYDQSIPPDHLTESPYDYCGKVWFQSVGSEGAGQQITVTVKWADDNMTEWKYSSAFGDPASDWIADTDGIVSNTWTIDSGDSDSTLTITVRDNESIEDAIVIDFKVDNTDPGTPTNAQCRPDSYTDVGETDDDRGIFFTWTNTNDGAGSGIKNYYAELEDNTPDEEAGFDEKDFDVSPRSGVVTYYVRAKDNVGNWGDTDNDTINIINLNPAVDLGIVPEQQRKDAKMLILDGANETGNHRWDNPHAGPQPPIGPGHNWHLSPICSWNCWAASTSMINSFYHNNEKKLTQDRIRYQEFGRWIAQDDWGNNDNDNRDDDNQLAWMTTLLANGKKVPENDFLWDRTFTGAEQSPGIIGWHKHALLAWALGVNFNQVTYIYWDGVAGTYREHPTGNPVVRPTFNWVRNLIDNHRPVMRSDGRHVTIIDGYHQNATGQFVHFIDPWTATETHMTFANWELPTMNLAYLNVGVNPKPRRDEDVDNDGIRDTKDDSDCDGIVDFDEDNRFDTSKNDMDSDDDGVPDKQDLREYVFDNAGNYNHRHATRGNPDIDNDNHRKEEDSDNDNGGKKDGEEDKNKNGKYEAALGESDNFDAANENPSDFKWTVMIYMAAEDGLDDDAFADINWMEDVGSDGNLSIVVQVDFMNRFNGKTQRYFITNDTEPYKITSPLLLSCTEKNMGDPKTLEDFGIWATENFSADHYALIIWGRGYGWKGVCKDIVSENDILYMGELSEGLTPLPVLDVIGFDAGLMGMIEVGYQMFLHADIMVASEERVHPFGWPYETILADLKNNSNWDRTQFATRIVEDYHDYYTNITLDPLHTLSAINLNSDFVDLVSEVGVFADDMLGDHSQDEWGLEDYDKFFHIHYDPDDNVQIKVKNNLFDTERYNDANYIDLRDFMERIRDDADIPPPYKKETPNIVNKLKKGAGIIIAEEHGSAHPKSHGLSIYFPAYQTKYKNPFGKPFNNPFDDPWPSCAKNAGNKTNPNNLSIYAYDNTTEWGTSPYKPFNAKPPHPLKETPDFDFRDDTLWDEFLHRYYKPVADAGDVQVIFTDTPFAIVFLDGSGSSDADGNIKRWIWDLDATKDNPPGPFIPQGDDWDADENDETNDDNDVEGEFVKIVLEIGLHDIKLTVWDDHMDEPDTYANYYKTKKISHDKHVKTDQDHCIVWVIGKIIETGEPHFIDDEDIYVTSNTPIEINDYPEDFPHPIWNFYRDWYNGEWTYWMEYIGNFTLSGEGKHYIEYYGRVILDYEFTIIISPVFNKTYYVDDTPPTTIITVGSPKYGDNDEWVTTATEFNLSATDNISGVNKTYYRIWYNGLWTPWMEYSGNFTLSGEGKHYLEYYSVDNVGNVEEVHNQTHYVDDTPPETTKMIVDPKYGDNDEWVTTATEFNLSATDDLSGVAIIYYRIWYDGQWTPWTVYTGNFTLPSEGKHYLEYYSVDNLGNVECVHNQTHYVVSFVPVDDSYTDKRIPYRNYGTANTLQAYSSGGRYDRYMWLKFNLTWLSADNITSATLQLHTHTCWGRPPSVDRIFGVHFSSDDSWDEHAITWNNQPSFDSYAEDTVTNPSNFDVMEFNITDVVQSEADGDGFLTLVVKSEENTYTDYLSVYSKEKSEELRPHLEIG